LHRRGAGRFFWASKKQWNLGTGCGLVIGITKGKSPKLYTGGGRRQKEPGRQKKKKRSHPRTRRQGKRLKASVLVGWGGPLNP